MKFQHIIGICTINLFFTGCGSSGSSGPQPSQLQGWGSSSESIVKLDTSQQLEERVNASTEIIASLSRKFTEEKESYNFQEIVDSLKEDINVTGVDFKNNTMHIYDNTGGRLNIPLTVRVGKDIIDITDPANVDTSEKVLAKKNKKNHFLLRKTNHNLLRKNVSPNYETKKALIYAPYLVNWGESDTFVACSMKYNFEKMGYKVDFITDRPINKIYSVDDNTVWLCKVNPSSFRGKGIDKTISYLNHLNDYAAIYISSHGGEDIISTGIVLDGSQLDNPTVNLFSKTIGVELGGGTLFKWFGPRNSDDNITHPSLVLKSDFFKNKSFNQSIFQVDACNVGKNNNFSTNIIKSGAAVFLSYTDSIRAQISLDFTVPLYERMAEGKSLQASLIDKPIIKQKWNLDNKYYPEVRLVLSENNTNFYFNPPLDTTPPIITLKGSALVYSDINKEYVDEGATAKDDRDGDIEVIIDTTKVNTAKLGIYSVIITAEDKAGNKATKIRKVQIVEGDTPVNTGTTTVTLGGGSYKNFPVPIGQYDKGDFAYVTPSYAINSVGDTYFTTYVFKLDNKVDSNNLSLKIRFRASSDEGGVGPMQTSFKIYELDENKDQTTYVPPGIENSAVSLRFRGNSSFGSDLFPYFRAFANVSNGTNNSVIDMGEWLEAEILITEGTVYSKYDDVIYKTIDYNANEEHSFNMITLTFQGSAYVDYVKLFKEENLIYEEDFKN